MTGEVIEINENNIVIKCEKLNDFISYEDELCDYYIYSDEFVELEVGDEKNLQQFLSIFITDINYQ